MVLWLDELHITTLGKLWDALILQYMVHQVVALHAARSFSDIKNMDSVLGSDGNNRPNVRDVATPLINLFHSEPGNGLWKRQADSAFMHCKTMKSFFEETLVALPDSVLDAPIAGGIPSGREDLFADVHDLMSPPFNAREEEALYA
ncbi:hypothetical protein F3Y22_tig00004013pilonHSYRG00067 [Hibiscus syriacus]|uniref:Uncharacterized protein n=1 Tax=Hibiscus syriacus TaxID=106335 RepID=A0A6A3CI63_HIBSY|nr:hypothetical protein F3Y22_tig00004013pilonHSYRG00067 [Hibiscus syriacus]